MNQLNVAIVLTRVEKGWTNPSFKITRRNVRSNNDLNENEFEESIPTICNNLRFLHECFSTEQVAIVVQTTSIGRKDRLHPKLNCWVRCIN